MRAGMGVCVCVCVCVHSGGRAATHHSLDQGVRFKHEIPCVRAVTVLGVDNENR